MNSSLQSRNIIVAGKRTSMRLEPEMWDGLFDIARREELSINDICGEVERVRRQSSLTSAMRVFILSYFRNIPGGQSQQIIDKLTESQKSNPSPDSKKSPALASR